MKLKSILIISLFLTSLVSWGQQSANTIAEQINNLPLSVDKSTIEKLLKDFTKSNGDIKEIETGILNFLNNGKSEIIPIIEKQVIPNQTNAKSIFNYYYYTGIGLGAFCNKPKDAIEYLTKAIEIADKNGIVKELFHAVDGSVNPIYGNLAVNYERSGDLKNASSSYLRGAKLIYKYYPNNKKDLETYLGNSAYLMTKYLESLPKGQDKYGEYLWFVQDYSEIGNLECLSSLWNYFIDSHDKSGLNLIEFEVIPKEKDQTKIAEFFWATAEQFQYDKLYDDAAYYHIALILHSRANNLTKYLYDEHEGIRHSRHEQIAYCFEQDGQDENYVQCILNALSDIADDFGQDSKEFEYYSNYLYYLMDDPKYGPILQNKLTEMGF